jgi:hypothetical protein
MTSTTPPRPPRLLVRATWIAMVVNVVLLSIGCSPTNLAMFLNVFGDNNLPPEYPLITDKKKEPTVVVMANFSQLEDRREVLPSDNELAEKVAQHMKLRAEANKQKLKIVPVSQVRSYQTKLGTRNGASPLEVGKHFKSDYVVYLEINSIALYERKSFGDLYRGNAEVAISLYELDKPEGEQKVFDKPYRCEYPTSGPRDAGSCSVIQFRGQFLTKIAREVSKMFVAFSPDERTEME